MILKVKSVENWSLIEILKFDIIQFIGLFKSKSMQKLLSKLACLDCTTATKPVAL